MAKKQKIKVSERALLQRLNRALAKDDLHVKTCREATRSFHQLGRFYCVNLKRNFIDEMDIDLEEWGREQKVLQPWEELAE